MADGAAANRLSSEAAAALLDAIRRQDVYDVRSALKSFGADAERFVNTPVGVDGGERTFFLTEAMNTRDKQVISLLLDAGARPETRTHGETGKNAFYAAGADGACFDLLVKNMFRRFSGRALSDALHGAIVGAAGQKTDSCLFALADKKNFDAMFMLLDFLPNDSSRRQALEQFVSPVGYGFDAKTKSDGVILHPGKSINLLTAVEILDNDRYGYRNPIQDRIYQMYRMVRYSSEDPAYYYSPRSEGGPQTTAQERKALEMKMQAAQGGVTAAQMRAWLEADEPATMPPPLAQRFLAALPGLSGGGGFSASFNATSGAAVSQLQQIFDSFGDETKQIINTPILNSDGTRTMLLTEIVNAGNGAAIDLALKYGADPAQRADGGSGKNAFYALDIKAGHVDKLVQGLRARYTDSRAADKAVHDAILGAQGQVTPSALVYLVDDGKDAVARALFEALPNRASRAHALENAFSPMGLKVDQEARTAGIYLSVDKCFMLQDIQELRLEKLRPGYNSYNSPTPYFSAQAAQVNSSDRENGEFYYVTPRIYNYMVNQGTRDTEERRYKELRAKEVAQQKSYRDMLRDALEQKEQAEKDLKREQDAFKEQERRLRGLAAEVAGLEDQVKRNDETLAQLGQERGTLKKRLQTLTNGI